MSTPDKGAGPKITQDILYNNGGTIIAGTIYAVNTNGTVNLVSFDAAGATNRPNVGYSPSAQTSGTWGYPDFQ